jgi:hypothetical protein
LSETLDPAQRSRGRSPKKPEPLRSLPVRIIGYLLVLLGIAGAVLAAIEWPGLLNDIGTAFLAATLLAPFIRWLRKRR